MPQPFIAFMISGLLVVLSAFSKPSFAAISSPTATVNIEKQAQQIQRKAKNIDPKTLRLGLKAYHKAQKKGLVQKPYLTVIDYSRKSTEKRLWVINLKNHSVTYNTYVAHGKNSGQLKPTRFSNKGGSRASSLGTFVTKETYMGGNGYSLRMSGLEKGVNDRAYSRLVVMHGAKYVSDSFIKRNGYLGRSWGCPAVPAALAKPIINTIKNGSVIFAYYPQKSWLSKSSYVA